MNENPYAAPQTMGVIDDAPTGDETIRQQYLRHEASVKSIGSLYLVGAILLVPFGLYLLIGGILELAKGDSTAIGVATMGAVYLGLGALQAATAIGLRRLQPWARVVAALLSLFGLLAFPLGTLISGYFLWLLLSKKGAFIVSDEYRRVVAATPHIKYKSSIIVVAFLVLLVILVVMGIIAPSIRSTVQCARLASVFQTVRDAHRTLIHL